MKTGQNVSIPRGNTRIIRIPVEQAGTPYDLTNHRLFYTIKDGTSVILTKDSDVTGSGIGLRSGSTTEVEVTLTPTNTDIDVKTYKHELEVWHPDGSRWDAMHGDIEITSSTIHPATVT